MGVPQADQLGAISEPGSASQDSRPESGLVSAIVLTLSHIVLWICLLIVLLVVVPRFTRMFVEFDLALPALSQLVVQLSTAVVSYWYLFVILGIPLMTLDFLFLFLMGKVGRAVQITAGLLLALVPLLLGGLVFIAVWLPTTALVDGLS